MTALIVGVILVLAIAIGVVVANHFYFRKLYAVPWLLLLGPSDADKTTLLDSAMAGAVARRRWFDFAWHYIARQRGLRVSRTAKGVVVDVSGVVAFPSRGGDLTGWQRLLRVLGRSRPRRPVDGVMLAIPAPQLLNQPPVADLGATIRERLTELQTQLGFVLPVYVVVTQCDSLRGFADFAHAVPGRRQDMVGWSNDRASAAIDDALAGDLTALNALPFTGDWITEGLASVQRSVVRAQIDAFASHHPIASASDLFLFPAEIDRLANPLRALLEDVFRPSLYRESSFLRGFYLCGHSASRDAADAAATDPPLVLRTPSSSAVNFIEQLFDQKVFPERGLAIPLPDMAVRRVRSRLAAQVVCAVLAVVLAAGTAWSYVRLRDTQSAHADVIAMGRRMHRTSAATSEQVMRDRLRESRSFLERLQEIRPGWFIEIVTATFMPASIPTERAVSKEASRVFNDVVLADMRAGLEFKGRRWLEGARFQPGDRQGPLGPALENTAPYRALDRFATEYQQYVLNYLRYERLRRGDGASDPSATGELLLYLEGAPRSAPAPNGAPPAAPAPIRLSSTFARAVKAANAAPINCGVLETDTQSRNSLVRLQASALLQEFGARSFGNESPLVAAAYGVETGWARVWAGSRDRTDTEKLTALVDHTTKLSQAVTAWAALGTPSKALPIPVFDRPPFTRLQSPVTDPVCDALRPDLSDAIRDVELLRDQLTDRLLDIDVDPFGPLLEQGDKGLALTREVTALKDGFDALQREIFWPPQPPHTSGGLPANPSWRPEAIDDVVKVFEAFNTFRGRAFGGVSHAPREEVIQLVESEVAQLVVTRLELTATPAAMPPSTDVDTRLAEIAQLGESLAKLQPLVGLLAKQDLGTDVLRTLDEQAGGALLYIDRTATTRYPSIFARRSGQVFAEWATIRAAGPQADALKRWNGLVDEQREGARQLANLARPIVHYLAAARSQTPSRVASDLSTRWTGIAADVVNFDQKRPSALGALDAEMRDVVPAIVPETDCSTGGTTAGSAVNSSFFAGVRQEIAGEGLRRCRSVVEERYLVIAEAFNRLLSGQFPFSSALDDVPEATPERTAEFVRLYDSSGGRALSRPLQALGCSPGAVTFIRQMDVAYALLTSVAPPAATGTATVSPRFTLDVIPTAFRVARDHDEGGDQIGEWVMSVGRQTFRERELAAAKPAPWTTGDPVSVTLRFARDSPNLPVGPFARTEDRSVRFEFAGAWALFGLLRSGRTVAATAERLRDAAPIVLGFGVPVELDPNPARRLASGTNPVSSVKVFMRVRVFQSGKTDPLTVDEFPAEAPIRAACPGGA